MAHSYLLQDWTTVNGAASGTVKQGEDRYLDLGAYQDVALYLDVGTSAPTGLTIAVETSPLKEDAYFQAMHTFSSLTTGLQTLGIVRWASASVPLARFVRWKVTASTAWNVTFRIWVNANQAGGR